MGECRQASGVLIEFRRNSYFVILLYHGRFILALYGSIGPDVIRNIRNSRSKSASLEFQFAARSRFLLDLGASSLRPTPVL